MLVHIFEEKHDNEATLCVPKREVGALFGGEVAIERRLDSRRCAAATEKMGLGLVQGVLFWGVRQTDALGGTGAHAL